MPVSRSATTQGAALTKLKITGFPNVVANARDPGKPQRSIIVVGKQPRQLNREKQCAGLRPAAAFGGFYALAFDHAG
jgi:hypothetical protein